MKKFLISFLMIAALGLTGAQVNAQTIVNDDYYYYSFAVDTATNSDTLEFEVPVSFTDPYDFAWFVDVDTLTGTTSATGYFQECADLNGTYYGTRLSWTLGHAVRDTLYTGQLYGARPRFYLISSGTMTTQYTVRFAAKKRKSPR